MQSIIAKTLLLLICLGISFNSYSVETIAFDSWTTDSSDIIIDTTLSDSSTTTDSGFTQITLEDGSTSTDTSTSTDPGFTQIIIVEDDPEPYIITIVDGIVEDDPEVYIITIVDGDDGTSSGTTSISGQLIDENTQQATANISIELYQLSDTTVMFKSVMSDSDGKYSFDALADGTYYVRTVATDTYVSKLFRNRACLNDCDIKSGTPIIINSYPTFPPGTRGPFNFIMESGGVISGTVTDRANDDPLQNISLRIYDDSNNYIASVQTDSNGYYHTGSSYLYLQNTVLDSGLYYIRTVNYKAYFDQYYDNNDCLSCDITASTAIQVIHNKITADINFSLKKGGQISGTIRADTGESLQYISISVYNDAGEYFGAGWTNEHGEYSSPTALVPGNYYVHTYDGINGYIDQKYNGEPCFSTCDYTADTAIIVTAGTITTGIDFALTKGGQISGSVIDTNSSLPIPSISINVYKSTGEYFGTGLTNDFGQYTTSKGLPTGDYTIYTRNRNGYINEYYDNQPCISYLCENFNTGKAIHVTQGSITENINFDLVLGGKISGTVTSSDAEQSLNFAHIHIYNSDGTLVDVGYSSPGWYNMGQYTSNANLPTGTYYAHSKNFQGFINQRFDNQTLAGPDGITDATPINVVAGETSSNINFTLDKGSRISGIVNFPQSAKSISPYYISITIFDTDGDPVSYSNINTKTGHYRSNAAVPPGDYYMLVSDKNGLLGSVLYGDIPYIHSCKEWQRCNVAMGALVTVHEGSDTENINFTLAIKKSSNIKITLPLKKVLSETENANDSKSNTSVQTNNGPIPKSGAGSISMALLTLLMLITLTLHYRRQTKHLSSKKLYF